LAGAALSKIDSVDDRDVSPELGTPAKCAEYGGLPPRWPAGKRAGMVWIKGGEIELGSTTGYADERPAGTPVHVDDFWIERTEVTNAAFSAFVDESGYVTEAEIDDFAAVFRPPEGDAATLDEQDPSTWWSLVKGASWRAPEGPGSSVDGRQNQPVVLVTYRDALAFAHWYGRDLPTEAEWEFAARSGGEPSGESAPRDDAGRPLANYWQGDFPSHNSAEDGFASRAPVGCFPPNRAGLHDMIGNVWELTRNSYEGEHSSHCTARVDVDSKQSAQRDGPVVIKGGSFLCAASYCSRYRASARYPQDAHLGASHVGFRTVLRAKRGHR
jgi:formylglycine-generating enzyme required for sulfatase activity